MQTPVKLNHYAKLDGLRGVAALMIMIFHFSLVFPAGTSSLFSSVKKIAVIGQTGVPLFFVLSGFLITRILIHSKHSKTYFSRFYIRRSLRIFPLYYLFLIISFIVLPLLQRNPVTSWHLSWYYYFYLQNISFTFGWKIADLNHLWSLAIEEHFYLLWPVIVYLCPTQKLAGIISGIIFFSILCRILLIQQGIGTFYFTLTTFDSLAIGGFLAVNEIYHWVTRKHFLLLLAILGTILLISFPFLSGTSLNIVQYTKLSVISLCYMALTGLIIDPNSNFLPVLNAKLLRYTGKISYGLYIYHPLCYALIAAHLHPANLLISLLLCFCSAYLIAALSYYSFELPFLRLKRRFPQTVS